jgi:translation elongation factor EF-4
MEVGILFLLLTQSSEQGAGHYERKMKHLENQKESKRRMKKMGRVELPQEAFFEILSNKQ